MPREASLQRKVIKYLRERGAYVFKVVGSPMQQRGTPDLLVSYRGRFIAIELKVPGEEPTRLQEYELAKVRESGGVAAVIESMVELERLLSVDPNLG